MAHYYDEHPEVLSNEREIEFSFLGQNFRFTSDTGVFSKAHVDEGSQLLLTALADWLKTMSQEEPERFRQLSNGRCLDLGCGYGVLGIVAKRRWTGQSWVFSDVNERALALTERNATANGIYHPETVKSNGWENLEGSFDLIVSNPPIRIGKEAIYGMFRGAAEHLQEGGAFVMVIGKKQGAESAGRYLRTLFDQVEIAEKKKGFFIYICSQPSEETV